MSRSIALVSLMVLACGPAISTDDDAGDGTVDDGGTDGSTASTTATTTVGTSATTTATTAGTSADTTSTTTAGTTIDPASCASDFVIGCQSSCAAYITCNPDQGPYEDCVTECIGALSDQSAECQQLYCEAYSCYGALDCATLETGSPECDAVFAKANELCGGGGDECFIAAGEGMCEYGCDGVVERRMRCDTVQCTCFENEVQTSVCPAGDICGSNGAIEELASACCGW